MKNHSNFFLTLISFFALVLFNNVQAFAFSGEWYKSFYAGASGSYVFTEDTDVRGTTEKLDFENGYGFSGQLGYETPGERGFLSNTRFEVEASYRTIDINNSTDIGNADFISFAYMANAYYDFNNYYNFTPYVGLGAGLANVKLADASLINLPDDNYDMIPAYQFMLGVGYTPKEDSFLKSVYLGYRYFNAIDKIDVDFQTGGSGAYSLEHHSIEAGIRIGLN